MKKTDKENDKIKRIIAENPEKYRSRIDESIGKIFLCSFNYPIPYSKMWILSNSSIVIVEIKKSTDVNNTSNHGRTIPISQIYNVTLDATSLSFDVAGARISRVDPTTQQTIWEADSPYDRINFCAHDANIAQAIYDRVGEATSNKPPS